MSMVVLPGNPGKVPATHARRQWDWGRGGRRARMGVSMAASFPLLESIDDPAQLRRLDRRDLVRLAAELRAFIVESVSATGGHLSANLGTVELTIALHYVFRT